MERSEIRLSAERPSLIPNNIRVASRFGQLQRNIAIARSVVCAGPPLPATGSGQALGKGGVLGTIVPMEGWHNGTAAVLKTAARKGFRVRIPGLPLNVNSINWVCLAGTCFPMAIG
jgi:hypothetical protein